MKKLFIPLFIYILASILALAIPASDGYNEIAWKLFVGQIFAIPVLIISIVLVFKYKKKL